MGRVRFSRYSCPQVQDRRGTRGAPRNCVWQKHVLEALDVTIGKVREFKTEFARTTGMVGGHDVRLIALLVAPTAHSVAALEGLG